MSKSKFSIDWSKTAEKDLETIVEHIFLDNEDIAHDIFSLIKNSVLGLENFPSHGRVVPELEYYFINTYREIIVKVWRVIYRIEGSNVYILAVMDSRRNIEDILLNRFLKS